MRLLGVLWRWASSLAIRVVSSAWRTVPTSGAGFRLFVSRKNRYVIFKRTSRSSYYRRMSRVVLVKGDDGGSMRFEIKDSKTAAETLDYVIDLTEELQKRGQSGEDDTISSVTWTVPSTMTSSGAYYSDFVCGVFLGSGAVGKSNVDALITTTAGRVYDIRLVVTVKNNT